MDIDMKDFEEAMKTSVEWFQKNCNPHQRIIIEADGVKLVSDEVAYPLNPVD